MPTPALRQIAMITVDLAPPQMLGQGRGGVRKIIPIVGGTVNGEISGRVLGIGADWQTVHSPQLAHLDARYAFETDDGAVIEIQNRGFRHASEEVSNALAEGHRVDPESYYFRTHALLETGDARYEWVNSRIFIGVGRREPATVILDLYLVE